MSGVLHNPFGGFKPTSGDALGQFAQPHASLIAGGALTVTALTADPNANEIVTLGMLYLSIINDGADPDDATTTGGAVVVMPSTDDLSAPQLVLEPGDAWDGWLRAERLFMRAEAPTRIRYSVTGVQNGV